MYLEKNIITVDEDPEPMQIPEKELIYQVIHTAILDASITDQSLLAWEAINFLFTNRVNPYTELLNLDPEHFKIGLIKMMETNRHSKSKRGGANARNFINNYEKYYDKPFQPKVSYDLIYASRK